MADTVRIDIEAELDGEVVESIGSTLLAGLREETRRAREVAEVLGRMRRRDGVLGRMAAALGERGEDGGR